MTALDERDLKGPSTTEIFQATTTKVRKFFKILTL